MSGKQCGKVPRMSYELENCKARKRGGGVGYRGGRGISAESWRVLFLGRRSPGEPFIPGHSGLSVVGSQCTDENVKSTYAGEKKKKKKLWNQENRTAAVIDTRPLTWLPGCRPYIPFVRCIKKKMWRKKEQKR